MDREIAAYIGASGAAILAFAWRWIRLVDAARRAQVAAQLELAREMAQLRAEVHALLVHHRQAVYRPYRKSPDDDEA